MMRLVVALLARLAPPVVATLLCAAPAIVSGQPSTAPVLTRAPELLTFVEAVYPPDAYAAGLEGEVVLALTLDAAGVVQDAVVVQSTDPTFDTAAREAALQFVFLPALIDDVAAPIRIQYVYRFVIATEVVIPPSSLRGRVLDGRTGDGLAGVTVTLADGTAVMTDELGGFGFEDVPVGTVALTLERDDLTPLLVEEVIGEGEAIEVEYEVVPSEMQMLGEGDDLELVITAPRVERAAAATRVDTREARSVAGTSGDVVRVVENLPGVSRGATGSSQLVVWGASPEDTRVFVDGVPLPRLYHESGVRTVIHPDQVRDVSLVPGGYAAPWGRGLGGVVLVQTEAPTRTGWHGSVAVDPYDGSLSQSYRNEAGTSVAASARYGIADRVASAVGIDSALAPVPQYWDGSARLGFRPTATASLDLVTLISADEVSRTVTNPDPALVAGERRRGSFERVYLRWLDEPSAGVRTELVPWFGQERSGRTNTFGSLRTAESSEAVLGGLRASHRLPILSHQRVALDLEAGLDIEVTRASHERTGSLSRPPREGDPRVFGQAPPDTITRDDWKTTRWGAAAWIQTPMRLLDGALRVEPGLRFDPYVRDTSRRTPADGLAPAQGLMREDFAAEPRLNVAWDAQSWLTLSAGGGRYQQYAADLDVSAGFGTPDLRAARATHVLGGVGVRPTAQLSLEATAFAAFSDRLAVRSPAATPRLAQALVETGEGRVRGVQMLVRQAAGDLPLQGWIAYTFSKAERRDGPDAGWRLFDFDQPHVLTAVLGYAPVRGLDLSARMRWASGQPRTPVVDAVFDSVRNRWEPVLGGRNTERLPDFVQLDLRVAYTWEPVEGQTLQTWLEVANATNRENTEEYVYQPDYQARAGITGLPVLPFVGVIWTY